VSEIATTEEAAAAVAASLLGQPGQPPVAVAEPAAPVVEAAAVQAVEQPAVEPQPEPAVVEAAPVAPLNLNPELPEEIAAEIAAAEIDEEVEAEVAAYQPETDEWGNPVEVDEDAVREAVKLRKRNEWLEQQLVKTKRGQWEAEAERYFPLAKHALGVRPRPSRHANRFRKRGGSRSPAPTARSPSPPSRRPNGSPAPAKTSVRARRP
jgi:hypothetical protein